tara:strand:+ start:2350 stop:2718 length:369 start_codon:yes stop_codon:yes gene_type:complete
MPKAEWGKKIVCSSCEIRFYDLNRKYPLTCPSCASNIDEVTVIDNSKDSKKVFIDEVKSINSTNLVGSDATESIATDDSLPLEEVEDDETISLEEADQDVDVIDTEVDDLSIEQDGNQVEED